MTSQQPASPDVIVVGAGSAGCAVAARLVERGRQVALLDAGPAVTAPPLWSLAGATDPLMSRGDRVLLGGARVLSTRRGVLVGGSGAVNGGYFLHSRAADHRRLEDAGGDAWSDEALRAVYRRVRPETWVDAELEPVSGAFVEAAQAAGFEWRDDLNATVGTGVGLVPFSARDGERVTPATAYLAPLHGHPGLEVRGGTPVGRVVLHEGRVRGVELGGERGARSAPVVVLSAPVVVLSAGAAGSAELLLRSGLGPAAQLGDRGIGVQGELSGVGTRSTNHPCVDLMYRPRATVRGDGASSFMQTLLHVDDDEWGGVVEVMATRRPYGIVTGTDPSDRLLSLRVTLMSPTGRGALGLGRAEQLELSAGDLLRSGDVRRLGRAVRQVAQLAAHPAIAGCVEEWHGPGVAVLEDDDALAAWVLDRLGTAYHLSGTAPMGPSDEEGSVVDGSLRVHGVDGLHVADTSILPAPLSCGPAAAAVMIGERAADLLV